LKIIGKEEGRKKEERKKGRERYSGRRKCLQIKQKGERCQFSFFMIRLKKFI